MTSSFARKNLPWKLARSRRILLVDEHVPSLRSMSYALSLCGHVCDWAESAGAAMVAIDGFAPECVVLEWNLKSGSGFGLARALRERSTALGRPLIIFAVSAVDEPNGFATREGIDQYFVKPVWMIRIAEALAEQDGCTYE